MPKERPTTREGHRQEKKTNSWKIKKLRVSTCYPHQHHENARRPSNSSKPTVREDFLLNFVDCNVQPNGHSADSSTHYFVSTFTTIQVPKKGVANFEERQARSVVGEFN